MADLHLSDGRVVDHKNHSIFREEILGKIRGGEPVPFTYKVALLECSGNVGACPRQTAFLGQRLWGFAWNVPHPSLPEKTKIT